MGWAGEALSSSRRHYPNVPSPLRRGVLHGCTFRIFTASMAFALRHRARHSLAPPVSGRVSQRRGRLHLTLRTVRLHTPRSGVLDTGLRHRPFPAGTSSLLPVLL